MIQTITRQVPAGWFRQAIGQATTGRYGACVTVHSESDYRAMRCYLTSDDSAGYAVTDTGDIVSVFIIGRSVTLPSLMAAAIAHGGRALDCFDTVLPALYSACGFVETARIAWDDAYAPAAWDRRTYARYNDGRPDVVTMALAA